MPTFRMKNVRFEALRQHRPGEKHWLWSRVAAGLWPWSCWEWQGHRDDKGYGDVMFCGREQGAHRFAWESEFGHIPNGLYVLHKCDNPPCVRPDHLFLGTKADNSLDMVRKGRQNSRPRTSKRFLCPSN